VKIQIGLLCFFLLVAGLLSTSTASADPVPPPGRLPVCGDEDGSETPFIISCPDLTQLPDVQTFTVSGSGDVQITFDFVFRQASLNNELGFILIDGPDASVDGLRPGDAGYLSALYRRAEIVFPGGSDASTADVVKSVPGGSVLLFLLVSNATLANFEVANPENSADRTPPMFFSWDALNPDGLDHFVGYQHRTEAYIQFGFEDLFSGGDLDYDDVVYNVSAVETGASIGPTAEDGGSDMLPVVGAAALALLVLSAGGGGYWFWKRSSAGAGGVVLSTRPRGEQQPVASLGPIMSPVLKVDAWLKVVSQEGDDLFPLSDEPVTIGFSGDCAINLPGGETGRPERVRIWRREGAYMLHNLSRFGLVTISGRPAGPWTVLEDGDEIMLGDQRLIFSRSSMASEG
jgi:Domain of unknown function (DUF4114)